MYYPSYANGYVYRGVLPMDVVKKELGEECAVNCHLYINEGGYVVTYPTDQGKFFNVGFTVHSDEPWTHDRWIKYNQMDAMKKDFDGWGPVVSKIVKVRNPSSRKALAKKF